MRCQRYYYQLGPYGALAPLGSGECRSTTEADFHIPLPVKMRTAPSVTFSAVNDFRVASGAVGFNSTAMALSIASVDAVKISVTTSGMTTGRAATLDNNQDTTNAAVYVSAEL